MVRIAHSQTPCKVPCQIPPVVIVNVNIHRTDIDIGFPIIEIFAIVVVAETHQAALVFANLTIIGRFIFVIIIRIVHLCGLVVVVSVAVVRGSAGVINRPDIGFRIEINVIIIITRQSGCRTTRGCKSYCRHRY